MPGRHIDLTFNVDGLLFKACLSPKTLPPQTEGLHDFQVRAFDNSGNPDPTPDSFGWTLDTAPPDTTIIFAIDGDGVTVKNGGSTGSKSISFVFEGSDEKFP